MKYIPKLRKKKTETKALCSEYVYINTSGELFKMDTEEQVKLILKENPTYQGYIIRTFEIKATENITI